MKSPTRERTARIRGLFARGRRRRSLTPRREEGPSAFPWRWTLEGVPPSGWGSTAYRPPSSAAAALMSSMMLLPLWTPLLTFAGEERTDEAASRALCVDA